MNEQQEILAKQTFHEEMLKLFKRTAKEVKYKPTRRLDMINKYGGYEAAIKILPTDSNTFDFTLLWEQERLDLSIEALVTKDRYKDLFPREVVDFCQKRLDEYNYAPKKLALEPDDMDVFLNSLLIDDEPIPFKEKEGEKILTVAATEDAISEIVNGTKWYELLINQSVFTLSNRDLLVKMFALGERGLTLKELSGLEGYSPTYPFYDVILALCKRIKTTLKLDPPTDKSGKVQWWAILFNGEAQDKKNFVWSLRKELREGIIRLMDEGIIPPIEVPVIEHIVEENKESIAIHTSSEKVPPVEEVKTPTEPIKELDNLTPSIEVNENVDTSTDDMDLMESTESTKEVEASNESAQWASLKESCIDYYGPVCELCGFDFGYTYGSTMDGFIHIHCLNSEKLNDLRTISPQEDLIPICCNCETVMNHKTPPYTANEIREMLKQNLK